MRIKFVKYLFSFIVLYVCITSCEGFHIFETWWSFAVFNNTEYDLIAILGDYPKDHSGIGGLPQAEWLINDNDEFNEKNKHGYQSFGSSGNGIPRRKVNMYIIDATYYQELKETYNDVSHDEFTSLVLDRLTGEMIVAKVILTKDDLKSTMAFPDSFQHIEYYRGNEIGRTLLFK